MISGEYFGWSYGWDKAGTLGFLVTSAFVALMYTTFIFSFTELTTAIPHAGGPFEYSRRAFGPIGGYLAGFATLVEFVFAPPAIALAIGAYVNVQFPALEPKWVALGAYLVFMALNIVGVTIAASFELVGHADRDLRAAASSWAWWRRASRPRTSSRAAGPAATAFGGGAWAGIFAAIPFAIWFFLAIEGVAMAAEETKNPSRSMPIAYIGGILTLVALALGVMVFAGGVGDWSQARQHQRSAAAGDEDRRRHEQRLAAHAGVARPVRPRRLLPRHHHRLLAADLRALARRLPAGAARPDPSAASARRTSPSSPAAWSASPPSSATS